MKGLLANPISVPELTADDDYKGAARIQISAYAHTCDLRKVVFE